MSVEEKSPVPLATCECAPCVEMRQKKVSLENIQTLKESAEVFELDGAAAIYVDTGFLKQVLHGTMRLESWSIGCWKVCFSCMSPVEMPTLGRYQLCSGCLAKGSTTSPTIIGHGNPGIKANLKSLFESYAMSRSIANRALNADDLYTTRSVMEPANNMGGMPPAKRTKHD